MTENVPSAARVLDLIELIAATPGGVLLREATARLNAPKSSTLMLLRTLVNRGYAHRDALSDRYVLSEDHRAGGFGWTSDPHARLVANARPIMENLVQALGESATFGVFDRPGHARALAQVEADVEVRYTANINRPIPLYCTAIGRVLVAGQPEETWGQLIGEGPFPAVTRHTVTDKSRVLDIVGQVRRQGYCVVMEEFALGGTGVAAPVLDDAGRAVAALNVGCVTNRFDEKGDRVIAALKAAAGALSETIRTPAPLADAVA